MSRGLHQRWSIS